MQNDYDLLISRIDDAIELSLVRQKSIYLGFFTEEEISTVKNYLDSIYFSDYCFFGGYENAVRMMLCIGEEQSFDDVLCTLHFTFRKCDELSHRDFLGALMSLGINRETVGDILVDKGFAYIFVKDEISDYLISQISKIGRVGVTVKKVYDVEIDYKAITEDIFITVSSLRIDNVISKLCNLSRSDSVKLILAENVFVNHIVVKKPAMTVSENDTITVRKKGKFIFTEILGISKKGKLKVLVKHFR